MSHGATGAGRALGEVVVLEAAAAGAGFELLEASEGGFGVVCCCCCGDVEELF